jgi:hypothetical protein
MVAADRTTIKAAIQEYVSLLRANLVADPPTADAPFRSVQQGHARGTEHPRPFLGIRLDRTKLLGASDDDKVIRVETVLRVVADAIGADPHDALLDTIGAVDDYLDSIREAGVIEGAAGFDERTWKFEYPSSTSGARLVAAEASSSFVACVEREQNRLPGP